METLLDEMLERSISGQDVYLMTVDENWRGPGSANFEVLGRKHLDEEAVETLENNDLIRVCGYESRAKLYQSELEDAEVEVRLEEDLLY